MHIPARPSSSALQQYFRSSFISYTLPPVFLDYDTYTDSIELSVYKQGKTETNPLLHAISVRIVSPIFLFCKSIFQYYVNFTRFFCCKSVLFRLPLPNSAILPNRLFLFACSPQGKRRQSAKPGKSTATTDLKKGSIYID